MKRVILFLLFAYCLAPTLLHGQNPVEEVELKKDASAYDQANSEYLLIDAEKFILLEDYERAIATLDQAIEVDQTNHAAYFKKAEVLIVQEQLDEALKSIEKAITLKTDNIYYYVLAAEINKKTEDLSAAADIYALMIANTQGYERYVTQMVDVFSQTDRADEALSVIELSLPYYPNYPELYLKKAELELYVGNSEKSVATIEEAFSKFPKDPTILVVYIQNLQTNGQITEALNVLESAEASFYQAKILLVDAYQSAGQIENANALALQFFEFEDYPIESKLLALGQLVPRSVNGDFDLVDSLQQKLAIDYPRSTMVFQNGGLIYSQMANVASLEQKGLYRSKAIDSFIAAAKLDPNNFEGWLKVFEFEIGLMEWNQLQTDVEYLLDLYPNQSLLFYYYAESYRGLGEYDEALNVIDQGLRMSGRNALLKSLLLAQKAKILASDGQLDEADLTYNEALNLEQVDERAIYLYAEWLTDQNPQASLDLARTFQNQISNSPKWTYLHIKANFNLGHTADAKAMIELMIENNPQAINGSLIELYGDILFNSGLTDEALEQWKKALTLGGFSEKLEEKIANKSYN